MDENRKNQIIESIKGKLLRNFGKNVEDATTEQLYQACAFTLRDQVMQIWVNAKEEIEKRDMKQLYYLSVEFLMGRALDNVMTNLKASEEYHAALHELGVEIGNLEDIEPDAGLGNGGLGRLAACFLDSLATLEYPAMGCGIRYEYGLFKQKIVNGYQTEEPDSWLENGNPWEIIVPEDTVEVHFGGRIEEEWNNGVLIVHHKDYATVNAVPYDVPIIGYDSKLPSTLRLWSASSPKRIDIVSISRGEYTKANEEKDLAEVISKVLYPEDKHVEGKTLRLKQHYFFVSATMQYIIREYKKRHSDLRKMPDYVKIQINDTHPGLAIPETMRILMDVEKLDWETAEEITKNIFAYTNHTIMSEALERWPISILQPLLPRIFTIINVINERFCKKLWQVYPGQWEKIHGMSIVNEYEINMANMCIAMSFKVNGVSQLHADILKRSVFRDFYIVDPDKFIGITNGITQRRWLLKCNPMLASLINEAIGPDWVKNPENLEKLMPFADDAAFREKFAAIKLENKRRFAKWLSEKQGVYINEHSLIDVQAKRLHEYKRQLLNILHVMCLYNDLCTDPTMAFAPQTFVFAAKAFPGYERAKLIIKLINCVGDLVNNDPRTKDKLKVVFVENYNISPAEILIPAADASEQISTAGKEASGTGNMKFMMNGAVTIGTMDGANVEIAELVGVENMFIFGLSADDAEYLSKEHRYNPGEVFETNGAVRKVINQLVDGTLPMDKPRLFSDLYYTLMFGDNGVADQYFVLKDLDPYKQAQKLMRETYADKEKWLRMAIINTAKSGFFSSDRTIEDYNRLIWGLQKM